MLKANQRQTVTYYIEQTCLERFEKYHMPGSDGKSQATHQPEAIC